MFYRISDPNDIRDLGEIYPEWVACNNPKAQAWAPLPPKPPYDPATETCQWVGGAWVVAPIVVPVPSQVPMWALREAVMFAGEMAAITNVLNSLPEPEKSIAWNRWEYKENIVRNSPIILQLQSMLGWSDSFVDGLYKNAAAIAQNPN
jgi:hypothetical protein